MHRRAAIPAIPAIPIRRLPCASPFVQLRSTGYSRRRFASIDPPFDCFPPTRAPPGDRDGHHPPVRLAAREPSRWVSTGTLNAGGACRGRDGRRTSGRGALRARPGCGATPPTWRRTPRASRRAQEDKQLWFPSWQSPRHERPMVTLSFQAIARSPIKLAPAPHAGAHSACPKVRKSESPEIRRAAPLAQHVLASYSRDKCRARDFRRIGERGPIRRGRAPHTLRAGNAPASRPAD